jgi:PKD repeat protein
MKNRILLFGTFLIFMMSGSAFSQCVAPITVTTTANPGEVSIEFDLVGFANQSNFMAEVWFDNTNTTATYGPVYVDYNNNPTLYTVPENGDYNVNATFSDSIGCNGTTTTTVTVSTAVNSTCNADFTIYQDSVNTNNIYWGYNNSTGNNLTYSWDFGDGGTSTDAFPTHTFLSTGTFNVCLTIDDGNGCTDVHCETITVVIKASQTSINIYNPNSTASIENEVESISAINAYPNPSNGLFNLEFTSDGDKDIIFQLIDLNGRIIYNEIMNAQFGSNTVNIDVQGIESGMYFYMMDNTNQGRIIIK